MEQIRSFIAIELPDDLKTALTRLEEQLKASRLPSIKWVDPKSIHLTLKFLGNIRTGQIDEITAAMEQAARGIPPFLLEVKGLGVFPNLQRVQVVWVGVGGDTERLIQLQKQIEANVAPLGFPTEARPFAAHLTIARVRDYVSPDDRKAFGQLIASTNFELEYSLKVDSVNLMKSQLTRQGPIYSRLSSVQLA